METNQLMASKLSTNNHCSDIVGLKYIYPVLSRRTGGLSIGVNFNTNNACNWRCIYCQVPNLKIGAAPNINFHVLEEELRFFLDLVINGNFYECFSVEQDKRAIKDIAIAGNGEPTSLRGFAGAVQLIGSVANEFGVFPSSDYVLITNGSLLNKPRVQEGLQILKHFGGEVWFKLDSATAEGRRFINNTGQSIETAIQNLKISARLCPTKLQICLFSYDKQGLTFYERTAFLAVLKTVKAETNVNVVMLYTIARPSLQPESVKLEPMVLATMTEFADEIRALGFEVSVSI
jgi:wyosine [tRNA(Phe)-imidazoG37] synthetase (radical SAM superfamily)